MSTSTPLAFSRPVGETIEPMGKLFPFLKSEGDVSRAQTLLASCTLESLPPGYQTWAAVARLNDHGIGLIVAREVWNKVSTSDLNNTMKSFKDAIRNSQINDFRETENTRHCMDALVEWQRSNILLFPVRVQRLSEEHKALETDEFHLSLESVMWLASAHVTELERRHTTIACLGECYRHLPPGSESDPDSVPSKIPLLACDYSHGRTLYSRSAEHLPNKSAISAIGRVWNP